MEIQLKNISKSFENKKVLDKINIVFKNPITCIMGASGSGKTTLINIISGLVKQDNGEVEGVKDKKIGVVFQEDRLCENIDSVKNVELVCKKSKEEIRTELENIGLKDNTGKPVKKLSGGMRRRVCIVRALMYEPDIVIMDEPFKGLDDETKKNTIKYIKKRLGDRMLLVITHDKEDIGYLGAEVVYF